MVQDLVLVVQHLSENWLWDGKEILGEVAKEFMIEHTYTVTLHQLLWAMVDKVRPYTHTVTLPASQNPANP
eukprot:7582163-Pyramimonas_sp.AAC.1